MSYRTLATILTDLAGEEATLDAAVATAAENDAHLDVICIGIDRTQPAAYFTGTDAFPIQDALEEARREAERLEAEVRERLSRSDVRTEVIAAAVPSGGLGALVAEQTQFADLIILPRPYGEGREREHIAVVEASLFSAGNPVVVLPPGMRDAVRPRTAVLAWNDSAEALKAIRAALPFLRRCERTWIAIVDPPPHAPDRSDPGGALAQMLSRHDVRVEVSVLARQVPRISDILCRFAGDCQADMIVMGAYGHSRFREAILGGATRNMLEQARIPVLMAH